MKKYDAVIIGAGHNGLITAYYLAKAGLKTVVLERRGIVGGGAITQEFHPGFKCSTLSGSPGPLLPQISKEFELRRRGVEFVDPPVRVFAPNANGNSVCIYEDVNRTTEELKKVDAKDAGNFPEFISTFARIGKALTSLLTMTPPDPGQLSKKHAWQLGKLGLGIRGLGKKDEYRLFRYGPMAVADLAAEWFENETLRALVAARGISGAFAGPWSAGTSAALLLQAANGGHPLAPATVVKGGMGALANALADAAREAGAEVRTNVAVKQILVTNGEATGVLLEDGSEVPAWVNASAHDPGITILQLIDTWELEPTYRSHMQNVRAHGVVAKVQLALSALPQFVRLAGNEAEEKLSGRIQIGPDIDYLERAFDAAKYGEMSPRPYLDIRIPSLADPSLAPKGAHVMSIHAQFAPYDLKQGDWNSKREQLGEIVVDTIAEYAPGIRELILGRQVITPLDLEQVYGLRNGHIHHGEMSLDQLFAFRPLIGWAQYRTPIRGLYLCGAGTHPGGGVSGGPGANAAREIIKDFKRRKA
jgi:phytoene dehydrogenase-like protein